MIMSEAALVLGGKTKYGFFADGVLDAIMECDISFPYIVSSSGGSCSAAGFLAGQKGRHFRQSEEAYRQGNMLQSGFIQRFFGGGEKTGEQILPFDYPAYFSNPCRHELALTDYDTGKAAYFTERKSVRRLELLLEASAAEPVFNREVKIGAGEYFTGLLSDAIPVERAMKQGYKRMLLILSEPLGQRQTGQRPMGQRSLLEQSLSSFYLLAFRQHPAFAHRASVYDELLKKQLSQVKSGASSGSLMVIQPQPEYAEKATSPVDTYHHGREQLLRQLDKIRDFIMGAKNER